MAVISTCSADQRENKVYPLTHRASLRSSDWPVRRGISSTLVCSSSQCVILSSAGALNLLGIRNRPAPTKTTRLSHILLSYQPIVFGFRNDVNELLEVALDVIYMESMMRAERCQVCQAKLSAHPSRRWDTDCAERIISKLARSRWRPQACDVRMGISM